MNRNTQIIRIQLFALICVMGSTGAVFSSEDTARIRLGKNLFLIPEANLLEETVPNWLKWVPGLDDASKSLLFVIPADQVSSAVPGYRTIDGKYREDIRGHLAVLNEEEKERYRKPEQLKDLWFSTGSYRERIVEPYQEKFFKVFRSVEYPYSWALVNTYPDSSKEIPQNALDFWIARCQSGNSTITESKKHVNCRSYIVVDNLLIEFRLSENNISKIENIRSFLTRKILGWRK